MDYLDKEIIRRPKDIEKMIDDDESKLIHAVLDDTRIKMTKTLFALFLISLSLCSKVVAQEQKGIPMDALISEWSLNESELVEGYDDINDYFYYKESDENFTVFYYLNGDICTMLFIWPHYEDGVSAWVDYLNSNTSVESPDEVWKGVVRGVDVDISVEWAEESPYFQWIFR